MGEQLPGVRQVFPVEQKRLPHRRRVGQVITPGKCAGLVLPGQAGFQSRLNLPLLAQGPRAVHEQNQLPLISVRDHGSEVTVQQVRQPLQNGGGVPVVPLLLPMENHHVVDCGYINVEDIGQTAHFHGFILENGAHQLPNSHRLVLGTPDIGRQAHRVPGLFHRRAGQGFPFPEDEKLHPAALVQLHGHAAEPVIRAVYADVCLPLRLREISGLQKVP